MVQVDLNDTKHMTPGDVFNVVRDAYYREHPYGSNFKGHELTPTRGETHGDWHAEISGSILTHFYFCDGRTIISQRSPIAGSIWFDRGSFYYADPEYLRKVLDIALGLTKFSTGPQAIVRPTIQ